MQAHKLLAAAIVLVSLTSTLRAENLLTNPGFERSLDGWIVTIQPGGAGFYTLSATNAAGTSVAQVLIRIMDARRRAVRR